MKTLLTSNKRHDLLQKTLDSFWSEQEFCRLHVSIHEDEFFDSEGEKMISRVAGQFVSGEVLDVVFTEKIGQHKSIERFINEHPNNKYYLHLENDWLFTNSYNWIQASIDIMEADPSIIKVLVRKDSPHPVNCDHKLKRKAVLVNVGEALNYIDYNLNFGYLEPWENNGINWCGFSWNPGVTRLDLLRQFIPFGKHEQDVAQAIYDAGYKVVALEKGVCEHIGFGRSTHD